MSIPLNASYRYTNNPVELSRYNMIEQQIRPWQVYDAGVLELLGQVRREDFVPEAFRNMAFTDMEIPLRGDPEEAVRMGECMLTPKVEARLLQDLKVQPHERVLEIGAGSGFMAALLARSAKQVVTLEIEPELADMARRNLARAGIGNVEVRLGDGAHDALPGSPFDVIVLSGSVAEVPQHLLQQVRDGGRLAAFVGQEPVMRTTLVQRSGQGFVTTQPWDTDTGRLRNFPEPSRFRF